MMDAFECRCKAWKRSPLSWSESSNTSSRTVSFFRKPLDAVPLGSTRGLLNGWKEGEAELMLDLWSRFSNVNHDPRRPAQPAKGLLLQLGPSAGAGTEAQQTNRFATVAQGQNEQPGTPVLATLWVSHHRPAAVINLRLFPGRCLDHNSRFRRSRTTQFAHEALHALVAATIMITAMHHYRMTYLMFLLAC